MSKIFSTSIQTLNKNISAISCFRNFRFFSLVFFSLLVVISCGGTTAASDDDEEEDTTISCTDPLTPSDKATLSANIAALYAQCGGNNANYSIINVSAVTDMSQLFKDNSTFNGNISSWNMSGVTNVNSMFEGATAFAQDLSGWKLNAQAVVKDSATATKMFYLSGMKPGNLPGNNFYQYTPTTKAELQTAITTEVGKQGATADLSIIDTSGVTDMASLFANDDTFNGYISTWVMSGVTTVTSMFENATNFNQDLSGWVLKAGVIAKGSNSPTKMFYKSGMLPKMLPTMNFYQYTPADNVALKKAVDDEIDTAVQGATADLSIIDTSGIDDMSSVFRYELDAQGNPVLVGRNTFNGYVATWDTSKVETMERMFSGTQSFNQPIGNWDTSSVENMKSMFGQTVAFNQPLKDWNTSKVKDFSYIFQLAKAFNQNIKGWSKDANPNTTGMFIAADAMEENNKADWMK